MWCCRTWCVRSFRRVPFFSPCWCEVSIQPTTLRIISVYELGPARTVHLLLLVIGGWPHRSHAGRFSVIRCHENQPADILLFSGTGMSRISSVDGAWPFNSLV